MSRTQGLISGAAILIVVLAFSIPAFGQIEAADFGLQAKTIEPGDATTMDDIPRPAALGSGVTIMRFRLSDVDPQADDPSDVTLQEFVIHNLGTADENDIAEILCMDQDGNAVAPLLTGVNPGPNANVGFQATCELDGFIIPDGQSEVFEIAVRTVGTNELQDDDQNNTIQLRVTTRYRETVGSPPTQTEFTTEVTDGAPEHIYNGGINDVSEGSYGADSLMPGEQGVVSRFTVCDADSNEHNLTIDQIAVKQGADGTALFTDFASIELYRVEANRRTLVGTLTPETPTNRGGASDTLLLPTDVFLRDDSCTSFEVEAQISPFAFKGKLIQFEYQISAAEPVNFQIDESVDPRIVSAQTVAIGKGLIRIPDTVVLAERSDGSASTAEIPLQVRGIPLPGFGALQVGPEGALSYDPDVIRVRDIVSADPDKYVVDIVRRDNQRGQTRFTIRARQALINRTGDPDADPEDLPIRNGTIAFIRVETVGNPGQSTRLTLQFDEVKDIQNRVLTEDVVTDAGLIQIVALGDVDQDGTVAINDALMLARQLTVDCEDLSDTQKQIADVAEPKARADEIPVCGVTVTSADVATIARLAIESEANASGTSTLDEPNRGLVPLSVAGIQTSLSDAVLDLTVQGQGIAGVELSMFDLAGQQVLHRTSRNSTLRARLTTDTGRPLANGVYLYTVAVRGVNGQVVHSNVRKLVVLR